VIATFLTSSKSLFKYHYEGLHNTDKLSSSSSMWSKPCQELGRTWMLAGFSTQVTYLLTTTHSTNLNMPYISTCLLLCKCHQLIANLVDAFIDCLGLICKTSNYFHLLQRLIAKCRACIFYDNVLTKQLNESALLQAASKSKQYINTVVFVHTAHPLSLNRHVLISVTRYTYGWVISQFICVIYCTLITFVFSIYIYI